MTRPATTLKQRLADGEVTLGSWLSFPYLPLTEMLTSGEFEWLVIDLEHTAIDFHDVLRMVMLIEHAGVSPLVRVGANDPLIVKRVMDAGAHGIVVPDVRHAKDARRAVDAVYYPPRGRRGAGLGRAHGYGLRFQEYVEWLQQNAVVVVQIEHHEAIEDLASIVAVDGVDAFMLGPYDLSASIGRPGDFEGGDFQALYARVGEVMTTAGKPAGIHVVHPRISDLRRRVAEGFRMIAYGDDMVFYAEAVDRVLKELRGLRRE